MAYLFVKLHEVWQFKEICDEFWEGNEKVLLSKKGLGQER